LSTNHYETESSPSKQKDKTTLLPIMENGSPIRNTRSQISIFSVEKPENVKIEVPSHQDSACSEIISNISYELKKDEIFSEDEANNENNIHELAIKSQDQSQHKSPDLEENDQPVIIQQKNPEVNARNERVKKVQRKSNFETNSNKKLNKKSSDNSLNYEEEEINISFVEYVFSFFRKDERTAEKMAILNKGMKDISERLDIFNIMRKFREIDKLKALLLEDDQLVLFNGIPKAEMKIDESDEIKKHGSPNNKLLKSTIFVESKGKKDQIVTSYFNIQSKPKKSKIDRKLVQVYEEFIK